MKKTSFFVVLIILSVLSFAQRNFYKDNKSNKSIPDIPANLTATAYSSTTIYLDWDDVSSETEYYIYKSIGGYYF